MVKEEVAGVLFHYHFWTPYVEETEKFYVENGFRISQRIGKYQGDFQTFHPPLKWDDFRTKNILFRIIEARKGGINITFGYGKKVTFDHIGFLVSETDREQICQHAEKLNWAVDRGERRNFISTPYHFRIELQTNKDAVDSYNDSVKIEELTVVTTRKGLEADLSILFDHSVTNIHSVVGDVVTLKEVVIKNFLTAELVDPNGVKIVN